MNKRTSLSFLLFAVLLFTFSRMVLAASNPGPEAALLDAMRLDRKTNERVADSGKAIQAYRREGFINKKPSTRADYTDYHFLRKPAKFLGHDLVLIEEEYMSQYVGCCVSPGVGVTVRVVGTTANLEKFAAENDCSFTGQVPFNKESAELGYKGKVPKGNYVSLSCREHDAQSKENDEAKP